MGNESGKGFVNSDIGVVANLLLILAQVLVPTKIVKVLPLFVTFHII